MTKILFVCHGNICRSPMAEFVLKDMVNKKGLQDEYEIRSAATSTEEIGSPVHSGTRKILSEHGISCAGKVAVQIKKSDCEYYDYIIGMDDMNIRNIKRICPPGTETKVFKLLDFAGEKRDISDPWYTGDFQKTYDDVIQGCNGLLKYIGKEI